LHSTLEALQWLRDLGHEVVVADGGSGDATRSIAAEACDRVIESEPGRGRQMNAGAIVTNGTLLVFLHADTRVAEAGWLKLIELAEQHCADWGRFDVRLDGEQKAFRLIERMISWRSRFVGVATGDQVMFVSRQLFDLVGGFAEIPLMEDVELSKRLRRRAAPICLRETVLTSSRRWEQFGILRTIVLMWTLRASYACGVSPATLERWYRNPPF
jgi:rSAM/selenodomain-associated transferase 2